MTEQRTDPPSTTNVTVEIRDVLGMTLDGDLSLDSDVSEIVKNCHFHLRALQPIRPRRVMSVDNKVACSVVD